MSTSPIVLVPGFFHGAWCWSLVATELAKLGRSSVAVDIAGHGLLARTPASATRRPFDAAAFATERSPVAEVGLDQAAEVLVTQIRAIGRGKPVVLVGHSMGGAVLTRVGELAPELVEHLVYVTGYMPASGTPCLAYPSLPEGEGQLVLGLLAADPMATGALRVDTRSDDPAIAEQLRQAFYGDVDPALARSAIGLLSCDAPTAMTTDSTTLTSERWGGVPRTYVVCTEDMTIRPPLQRLFIAQADAAFPGNPTKVATLPSSHSPFFSMPDRVASIIAAAG